jgi:hypothetical protein
MCSSASDSESDVLHPDDELDEEPVSSIRDPMSDEEVEIIEPVLRVLYIDEEVVECNGTSDKCVFERRLVRAWTVGANPEEENNGEGGFGLTGDSGTICACTLARPALATLSTARALVDAL